MKTPTHAHPSRAAREHKARAKQNYDQTLRACEDAAARIQSAADELAKCWKTLCQEIAAGVSPTGVLRTRAWCNVLELRLKEQTHALEEARQGVDAVWNDMMLTTRARELFNRFLKKNVSENAAANESLPLLMRTASALAAAHRRTVSLKK